MADENTGATTLSELLRPRKARVDAALEHYLPDPSVEPTQVHAAMRYAVLNGGKRLRPILALAVCEIAGEPPERVLPAACALELVHAASLILDDLPCMDNAATRRDKPCTHAQFGEATALLAVMGLIALAFDLAAANTTACGSPAAGSETAVHKLARAIGTAGLVRGQHVDLALTGRRATLELVETTYQQKAGALFLAAVQIPAGLAGMPAQDTARLEAYACGIGLAFQITDDLLDARAAAEDAGKSTFVSLLGVEGAQRRAQALVAEAVDALAPFGARAALLHTLANYVAIRAQ